MANNEEDTFLVDCNCNWVHCNKRLSTSTLYRHRLKYTLERQYPPRQRPRPMPVEAAFHFDDFVADNDPHTFGGPSALDQELHGT
jgi:hypothetical protein